MRKEARMPTKIEEYNKFKGVVLDAERWLSMVGKTYHGGGGGVGRICSMQSDCMPKIYFQEYDGANNYHSAGDVVDSFVNKEVEKMGEDLVRKAIAAMRERLSELAVEAADEYKQLMAEAGLGGVMDDLRPV